MPFVNIHIYNRFVLTDIKRVKQTMKSSKDYTLHCEKIDVHVMPANFMKT